MKGSLFLAGILIIRVAPTSSQAGNPKTAWVVNGATSSENLSRINLETNEVFNDVVDVGKTPNQIVIRGNKGYVVNSDRTSDNIQIVNLDADSTEGYIVMTQPYSVPWNMAFLNDTIAYVTNFNLNTVSVVNVISREVTDTIQVGIASEGVAVVGDKVYVTNTAWDSSAGTYGQGTVSLIEPATNSVVKVINVGTNPQDLALDADGELNVVCSGDYWLIPGKIYVINTVSDLVVDSIAIGGAPTAIAISPRGVAYLAAGGWYPSDYGFVYTFDTETNEVLRGPDNPILVGKGALGIGCDKDNYAYSCNWTANTVSQIDTNDVVVRTFSVGDGPVFIAIRPSSDSTWVAEQEEDLVPRDFALLQNYPNPFNATTVIHYQLSAVRGRPSADGDSRATSTIHVSLEIYNLLGQRVATLVDGYQKAGQRRVSWNASDFASGIYFCRLGAGEFTQTRRMILLR